MRLHLLSDIHLETGPYQLPNDLDFDVLIAAGDIGEGTLGIEWLKTSTDKPVVSVLGNHEYYSACKVERVDRLQEIRDAAAGSNVHVLDNESIVIGGVRFLGATLWTDFGDGHAGLMAEAGQRMNDFYEIREQGRRFDPKDALALHKESMQFLQCALVTPFDGETSVVVTHHHPHLDSLRRFGVDEALITDTRNWRRSRMSEHNETYRVAGYASDLSRFLATHSNEIGLWCCGHLHRLIDYANSGVRIVCNPRGYSFQCRGDQRYFNPRFILNPYDTLDDPINAEFAAIKPQLETLHNEILELSEHTEASDGIVRTAITEAIKSRATSFELEFNRGREYTISNLNGGRLGQFTGNVLSSPSLNFYVNDALDSQFGKPLPEETVRLLDAQNAAFRQMEIFTKVPELRRVEACRRIASGLHALRTAGYQVEFFWEKNAGKVPWRLLCGGLGRLFVCGQNDKESIRRINIIFNGHIRFRQNNASGFFNVPVLAAPDANGADEDIDDDDLAMFRNAKLRFQGEMVSKIIEIVTPGDILKRSMNENGVSLDDLRQKMAPYFSEVFGVLVGDCKLDLSVAKNLKTALNKPEEDWLQIQKKYDLQLQEACSGSLKIEP